jgi:LacI family transcriptional regulator
MSQKVSMADIAQRLGVSRATVSYVLNKPDTEMVGDAMRARVLAMAQEMGYHPNRAAQALAGRPSHLIELFVQGYYPMYYARAIYEFERQIWPTPYQLYIVHPNRWTEEEWETFDSGWPTDGSIIFDEAMPDQARISLKQRSRPVVALGMCPPTDVDHVFVDVYPALLEAIRHLAAQGGRVACLLPCPAETAVTLTLLRYRAYQQVMKEAGLAEEIIVTPEQSGPGTRTLTREIVRDHVARHGCPNAIFCFNDERAIATLAALRDLNYRVPQDVLLIGHDGIEDVNYHSPQLSTIQFPMEEGARLAWQLLQHRILQPDAPLQSVTLDAKLVLSDSSAR